MRTPLVSLTTRLVSMKTALLAKRTTPVAMSRGVLQPRARLVAMKVRALA
jgi:hypothetical protein